MEKHIILTNQHFKSIFLKSRVFFQIDTTSHNVHYVKYKARKQGIIGVFSGISRVHNDYHDVFDPKIVHNCGFFKTTNMTLFTILMILRFFPEVRGFSLILIILSRAFARGCVYDSWRIGHQRSVHRHDGPS